MQSGFDPARSCGHKRKYQSRADARATKRTMTRQIHETFNVYRCVFCGAWHIGHRLPRSMRAQADEEREDAMITSKLKRCRDWAWSYVTRYPGLASTQIAGATTSYTAMEVQAALWTLLGAGKVAYQDDHYTAIVPFEETKR